MNPSSQVLRPLTHYSLNTRCFPASHSVPIGVETRTQMPLLSNHAFVAAWATRRQRLVAAARRARDN